MRDGNLGMETSVELTSNQWLIDDHFRAAAAAPRVTLQSNFGEIIIIIALIGMQIAYRGGNTLAWVQEPELRAGSQMSQPQWLNSEPFSPSVSLAGG